MGCGSSTGTSVINSSTKVGSSTQNLTGAAIVDKVAPQEESGGQKGQTLSTTNQRKVQSSNPTHLKMEESIVDQKEKMDIVKVSDTTEVKDKGTEKILSPEEEEEKMKEHVSSLFEKAKESWIPLNDRNLLVDSETGKVTSKFRHIAFNTFMTHFKTKTYPLSVQDTYKSDLYLLMVAQDVIPKFCDMVVYMLKQGYMKEDGTEVDMDMYKPLVNSYGLLTNFTDNKIERADIVANHPEFLPYLAEYLKSVTERHLAGEESPQVLKLTSSPLSICHNIAMQHQNVPRLRTLGFVDVLKPFMNSPVEKVRLAAVAALADIVDEKQSEIIRADDRIMAFIRKCLDKAILEKNRRFLGWSTTEFARTVRRIALNDSNKSALVQHGILSSLVKLAESEDVLEQREAVRAMWTLSFDEGNQDVMISDDEWKPVDTFIRLRNSPDQEVRKTCQGALWTMRTKLAESEKYKEIGEKYGHTTMKDVVPSKKKKKVKKEGHIMISYQWQHQELLKKVRDGLRSNGFRVWMDIDDMEGSTLDAMARAVEDADVVLVCFSQKYKDSDNCRAEAEYAYQKKKKIIPLKMEMNYRPDGWLGFIIGAKLFFDFGGKYTFESRIEGLVKELWSKLNKDSVDGVIVPEHASVESSAPPMMATVHEPVNSGAPSSRVVPVNTAAIELVKKWTEKDVQKWMMKHSLTSQNIAKLTGIEIAFLILLKGESPDFFYKTITETLKITNLLTIAQFRFALDDTSL